MDYNGGVDIKTGKTNGGGVKIQKKMEEQYNNDGRRSIHLKNYDIDPHGTKEVNRALTFFKDSCAQILSKTDTKTTTEL